MLAPLKEIFRPSRQEIWRQLCDEINAVLISSNPAHGYKASASVNDWIVTIDVHSTKHGTTLTRMRAAFINKDGFRFSVYRQDFFSDIAKYFGMQDITIGFADFDRKFVIKSNNEIKAAQLFAQERMRQLIEANPEVLLEVRDDEGLLGPAFPADVDELYLHVIGMVTEIERIHSLYDLFAETLNQLCHIGSAYEEDPLLKI
jgi:hypothetical protein